MTLKIRTASFLSERFNVRSGELRGAYVYVS
jgi:hypothetical protein